MTTPDPQANPFQEDPARASAPNGFPAPEAPSFPQASAPDFDEATASPGATSYGTAYDPAGAQYVPGPEQPGAGQAPYGAATGAQPGYDQAAYGQQAYGQQAYGQPVFGQTAYAAPPKQWIVAVLLAFFLGYLGVHNFYLGYTTRGVVQLVLSLTFIGLIVTGIWAFIEFIMILMRSGSYGCDASGQPLA